mmetsp:Transcript_24592/g.47896  ORF Transcript_24592/g.47896 Transcript_24592/m.47896 type:complete len:201 (+) Transcript_24592:1287-1889(+)
MSTAVSILSPVRTQSFTPARLIVFMAWGTPSCSRSSTAVTPTSLRFVSMAAETSATRSFLLASVRLSAACNVFCHAVHSSKLTFFMPTTRHLRPSFENLEIASNVPESGSWSRRGIMTLSAPFVTHQYSWLCCTTTDIRLRSELNSISRRTVNRASSPEDGPSIDNSVVLEPRIRFLCLKWKPTLEAAWTRATSSGDIPE